MASVRKFHHLDLALAIVLSEVDGLPIGANDRARLQSRGALVQGENCRDALSGKAIEIDDELLNDITIEGNVCVGVWEKTGALNYKLKHATWNFDGVGNLTGSGVFISMSLLVAVVVASAFGYTVDGHLIHATPRWPWLLWVHGAVFSAQGRRCAARTLETQP